MEAHSTEVTLEAEPGLAEPITAPFSQYGREDWRVRRRRVPWTIGKYVGMEAIRMVEAQVASAEDIDKAMVHGYKHPMGPLKLTDLVGLDVRLKIAEYLHQELGSESFKPPQLMRDMVEAGKLGKKSGQGFYSWN